MATRERVERGATTEEAEHAVRREFGNVGLVKEITRETWGWIFCLRTGPEDFTRRLVRHHSAGGLLPEQYRFEDGRLWLGDQPMDTAEETDLFRLLGIPWIHPTKRL